MRREPLLTTLVLAVVLTAGCSGLLSGAGPDAATETTTVTPVKVPDIRTQPAPGVPARAAAADQPSGPVDTDSLVAANDRILSNTSYRLERVARIESLEGDGYMLIRRSRRVSADGAVHEHLLAQGTEPLRPSVLNSTLWQDDDATGTRATVSNGRTVLLTRLPAAPTRHVVGLDLTDRVLRDSDFRVRSPGNGTTTLVVEGRVGLSEREVPVAVGPPHNATARVTVTAEGQVKRVRVAFNTSYLERQVRVSVRHRIVGVGQTTVERPAWVNEVQ